MKDTKSGLTMLLSLGGLNGTVSLAALAGLFTVQNVVQNAILFMAGPGAIIAATLLGGAVKERAFSALISGLIATTIVIIAASFGPTILSNLNLTVLKLFGGLSVIVIGLLVMGFKIPTATPTIIIILGIILGVVWR